MASHERARARLTTLRDHLRHPTRLADSALVRSPCKAAQQQPQRDRELFVSADEAAALIQDGSCITFSGFVASGCPEAVVEAIRRRFDASAHPAGLKLVQGVLAGNGKGRGQGRLAVDGLVTRLVAAWYGLSPEFVKLIRAGKMEGWNFPFGAVSQMIRDAAAGRVGPVIRIGIGTYVDDKGGKLTSPSQEDLVRRVTVGGSELLHYAAPVIDVAVLRGTTADTAGNISFEREAVLGDSLNQAMAAHNSGGMVIVQVERVVESGTLPPRCVHLPAALVDKVVVALPDLHWQTLSSPAYDGSLSGEWRRPSTHLRQLPMDERKVIAHRAMLEIDRPHAIINLGIGMPEGVSVIVKTHTADNPVVAGITLSTEVGMMGGSPCGGLLFGTAHNADAHMPTPSMLDFYNGGGCDAAFLGCAEVDAEGNVNVSNFPSGRSPGCGGFIDISQSAKKVVFVGTLTSGGLKVSLQDGQLRVNKEGRHRKFVKKVFEKTFAAAASGGRPILYVTERAVFRLRPGEGIELIEVAPGIDIEAQVLAQMDFRPIMRDVKTMDVRIFQP